MSEFQQQPDDPPCARAEQRLGEELAGGALAGIAEGRIGRDRAGHAANPPPRRDRHRPGEDHLPGLRCEDGRPQNAPVATCHHLHHPLGPAFGHGTVIAVQRDRLGADVTDLGILPDDEDTIRDSLSRAAEDHDILITSGGVSLGEEDHVKAAVESLGSLHFWRLAIKPGRPIALGQVGKTAFVGLPGNPVAAMVTFMRIARPLILVLSGARDAEPVLFKVPAGFSSSKKPGRREWLRASLKTDDDGVTRVYQYPAGGSGVLTSMVASDGLIELPEDVTRINEGEPVDFLPFSEVCP